MRFMLIYKVVLSPVLLAQGRRVRRTALRLTEAAGERSGLVVVESVEPELKLLIVGDSTMAGVGVEHQSSPLPRRWPLYSPIALTDPFDGNWWPSRL